MIGLKTIKAFTKQRSWPVKNLSISILMRMTGVFRVRDMFHGTIYLRRYQKSSIKASIESVVDFHGNHVWRQLAPDGDTLSREGIAFIKKMKQKYGM